MKAMIANEIQQLKDEFEDSESVWFLVDLKYRILDFNQKAASNSITFHNKEICTGASIIDYARDTKKQIDSDFIECFGKASNGQKVQHEQNISYNTATISARSVYTPVFLDQELYGISIVINYTPVKS